MTPPTDLLSSRRAAGQAWQVRSRADDGEGKQAGQEACRGVDAALPPRGPEACARPGEEQSGLTA